MKTTVKKIKKSPKPKKWVLCEAFGSRCNICGTYFEEGDDICAHGHKIGEQYSF